MNKLFLAVPLSILISLAIAACGGDSTTDAGSDATTMDAGGEGGATDAGHDASATDGGGDDAGDVDAGPHDAGVDAGPHDAGTDLGDDAELPDLGPPDLGATPAERCTHTGGLVTTGLCCASTTSFPDTCAVGACGCAPGSSHSVSLCVCATGDCFDPTMGCVAE